jgi:hypothetical protein
MKQGLSFEAKNEPAVAVGIYQHCSEKHSHRYLSEFDFRYNNRIKLGVDDAMRADKALEGIKGKRLTYSQPR